jgi:zinc transport system permease protein
MGTGMSEFFSALTDPDIPFLRYAFLASILASLPFGVVGTYVVARRISYIAGAIAHCALGGIGAALYLQYRFGWTSYESLPLLGAVAQALLAALLIGLVSLYAREREDTVIGAVWAIGMAQGLLFIAKTPGYVEPMSYLFGGIVYVSRGDLLLAGGLAVVVTALSLFFYNKLVAVCFDEEFARLRGIRVEFYYLMLIGLTALTVVLLVRVVGIVMVIALLTLPAAVAGRFSRRIWQMMVLAVLFCMVFTSSGLAVSYVYDLPSGPTIILIGGAVYLLAIASGRAFAR